MRSSNISTSTSKLWTIIPFTHRQRQICCFLHTIALMMEAVLTSETLVNFYQSARRYYPEDSHCHSHCRENLWSYLTRTSWLCKYVSAAHRTIYSYIHIYDDGWRVLLKDLTYELWTVTKEFYYLHKEPSKTGHAVFTNRHAQQFGTVSWKCNLSCINIV